MFLTMPSARLPCCDDFFEIVLEQLGESSTSARILSIGAGASRFVQFVREFGGQRREVVDEVEGVLDFVRDAGGELTERGDFLGLHQAVLRAAEVVERAGSSCVRVWTSSNRRAFSMAMTAWSAKVCTRSIWRSENGPGCGRVSAKTPSTRPSPDHGNAKRGPEAARSAALRRRCTPDPPARRAM